MSDECGRYRNLVRMWTVALGVGGPLNNIMMWRKHCTVGPKWVQNIVVTNSISKESKQCSDEDSHSNSHLHDCHCQFSGPVQPFLLKPFKIIDPSQSNFSNGPAISEACATKAGTRSDPFTAPPVPQVSWVSLIAAIEVGNCGS